MVSSNAATVKAYLATLPAERRAAITALRRLILERLPAGFEEGMEYGMISYYVPLPRYPKTYNGKPLAIASLASQKNYMSLYLMEVYGSPEAARSFAEGFRKAGKKLDMGKACVRFKALEDLSLDAIGDAIAKTSVDDFIAHYEATRGARPAAVRARAKAASVATATARDRPARGAPAPGRRKLRKRQG